MTADIAMVSLFTFCTYDMQQIYILFAYDMSNSSTTVTILYKLVRLDENGEPLSKNALKKLLKKEAADKKKAEKAAARVSSQ